MEEAKKRPNIIFFFSDQQRWDTLGCYGQKLEVTPNLDRLASEGVRFENAFTCQPVCGPARSCLQTGRYATSSGCFRNDIPLPMNLKTIANYFAEADYEVAYVGKWHLASDTENGIDYQTRAIPPERRGGYADYWMAADILEFTSHGYDGYVYDKDMKKLEFKGYRTDCITDYALKYIAEKKSDKPFFLFISQIEPHHQNDRNRYEGPYGSGERFKDYDVPGDLANVEGDWKENYADYLGCCARLDFNVGKIVDELDRRGLRDNTVFMYTSDHGSHFRTRNKDLKSGSYDDYKRSCHEGSIRIPLIIQGPGFKGGKTIHELVSLIDVPVTLLACAGLKPVNFDGRPLQQLVEGVAENWPQEVFLQISEAWVARAIRTKRYKYCVYAPDKDAWKASGSDEYVDQYLYDIVKDPDEKENLIGRSQYETIRDKLAEILIRRMVEAGEGAPVICKNLRN